MSILLAASVALAGGLGAVTRFLLDGLIRNRVKTIIPAGTVFINISGSLLLGLLTGFAIDMHEPPILEIILGTGFLGGYTTFSTANIETVRLIQSGRIGRAITNALGTMAVSIAAVAAGLALGMLP